MATICEDYHKAGRQETNYFFAKSQEACLKDIERAFGVLQARFAIVRVSARFWDKKSL